MLQIVLQENVFALINVAMSQFHCLAQQSFLLSFKNFHQTFKATNIYHWYSWTSLQPPQRKKRHENRWYLNILL